jgi:DedD protein
MQPPEPRVSAPVPPVPPPAETRPAAVVAPEPPPKAKPSPESRPAPLVSESRATPKPVETKAVAKPPETRSATKVVDTRSSVKPPEPRPDTRSEAKPVVLAKVVEPKPPAVAATTIPTVGSWTVQLGSFSSDLNAKKLVDKLKAAGYKAYTEPRLEQGATVFKVRVGPTPGKAEAERLRQRIETQFEARGMLVPAR